MDSIHFNTGHAGLRSDTTVGWMRRLVLPSVLAWLLLPTVMTLTVDRAMAQCVYTPLSSGVSAPVSQTPELFVLSQSHPYWSAVGIRSDAGTNWDLSLYRATAAFPTCVDDLQGSSSETDGVDFVITDFNQSPQGSYYPQAVRSSGTGGAVIEWDDGPDALTVNGPLVSRATGDSDVLEAWDVYLSADIEYRFLVSSTGADVKLLLFKNATGAAYSAGRSAAEFETTSPLSYTPSMSGFYGVVVVNDDGAVGTYSMGVRACLPPVSLSPGVSQTTELADAFYSFHQMSTYWAAIGVRSSVNRQIEVNQRVGGGSYPACLDSILGSSALANPLADVVAVNFANEFLGTYYARIYQESPQDSGTAVVEWDDGPNDLFVDGIAVNRTTDASDVVEAWDVYLDAGTAYSFVFTRAEADLKLLLFKDTGTAWFGRASAEFEATGNHVYQATDEGFYGVVVVNDNGASGSYSLRVSSSTVAVQPEPVYPTKFISVSPNPARSFAEVSFSLARPASVSFEVLDVAGRTVAKLPATRRGAGRWSIAWRATSDGGSPVRPGLYFLRMRVDDHSIGVRKFTLVR